MGQRLSFEPKVYWHSSEQMTEVEDQSVKLLLGASVYLGEGVPWDAYQALYEQVYIREGLRVLQPNGYLVVIQTDAYQQGKVTPRNTYLPQHLLQNGFDLLDVKIWQRRKADFFQVPFSQVFVFGKQGQKTKRPNVKKCKAYFPGIWEFNQTKGGACNSFPDELCRLLVEAFTEPDELLVDPFAGTGRLLGMAARLGRRAIGYEIDLSLQECVNRNLLDFPTEGFA